MKGKLTPAVVEAWASLVRTERTLLDKVEEDLKRARLPPLDWYHVLYEIDRSPKGMMRQTGVQDRTQLAQYNVCRLVDRLEREGLVERRQCELDGRNNVLLITAKGRASLEADVKQWSAFHELVQRVTSTATGTAAGTGVSHV